MDEIEGILNRDKKVATYKLALFRAMAELTTQEPRCATWHPAGEVGVPIRRVAEKWLGYYWPILASTRFIPQSQAEGAGSGKAIKFRAALGALMSPYASNGEHGGLSAWQLALSAGRLSKWPALRLPGFRFSPALSRSSRCALPLRRASERVHRWSRSSFLLARAEPAPAAELPDHLIVRLIVTSVAPPNTLGPDRSCRTCWPRDGGSMKT